MSNLEEDNINESLKEIVTLFSNTFHKKEKEESNILLGDLITRLKKSNYHLENPENFNTMFIFKEKNLVKTIATCLHETSNEKIKNDKADFIYTNYSFLSSHISRLIETRCGSCCSVDKSRFIIKQYLNWLITDEINEPKYDEDHFWIPKFGTLKDWFEFCDGLYLLYYGRPDAYLKSYQMLITADIRKYRHLSHKWFLKLKNEDPILIGNTWDDKIESPLNNEYSQDNDNYFVFKPKLPQHLREKFIKTEHNDRLYGPYVNIPKNDVEKVYFETEEVFI